MRRLYIVLIHNSVVHGGVDLGVTEDLLDLFDGHSFVDGAGSHGPPELVRMDVGNMQFPSELAEADLDAADLQSRMRRVQGNEQSWIIIGPRCDIPLQMELRFGVKVNPTFLFALAVDDTFPFLEVDVADIQIDQLADAHSRRVQQVDDRHIPGDLAAIPEPLDILVCDGFLHRAFGLYLVDSSDWAFQNVILFFQPGEKAGDIAPDVVHGGFAAVVDFLIICEIGADLLRRDPTDRRFQNAEHVQDALAVIRDRPLGQSFHLFGVDEHIQIILVPGGLRLILVLAEPGQQDFLELFKLSNGQILRHVVQDFKDNFLHRGTSV